MNHGIAVTCYSEITMWRWPISLTVPFRLRCLILNPMRVFLYEFITGGGLWTTAEQTRPHGSLLIEGRAMVTALANDFLRLPNFRVDLLADVRILPELESLQGLDNLNITPVDSPSTHSQAFGELCKNCDKSLIIAPEFNGNLSRLTFFAEQNGGELLSPNSDFVTIFSDKHQSLARLRALGIQTSVGRLLTSPQDLPLDWVFPAVAKPNDGAGSYGARRVECRTEVPDLDWTLGPYCIEQFCPGAAVSVAVLMGARSSYVLAPCLQRLSEDGTFRYLGGSVMTPGPLTRRATAIGRRVADVLPSTVGYIGVDLVLGDADDGSNDFVIEINPRLTTSYVGLRVSADGNLAGAMLRAADGVEKLNLRFPRHPLEFRADGTIVTSRFQTEPSCGG